MPVFRILLVLFIIVPLLELYLLIKVGTAIGVMETIALCLFTAALGAALLRLQGLQTLAAIQAKLDRREIPATDLLAGAILLISGTLLLTPGFFTDCIGFLCLIPAFREKIANKLLLHILRQQSGDSGPNVIVEGEFWDDNRDDNNKRLP